MAAAYWTRLDLLHRVARSVLPGPGRILDVGCAQGTLGLQLAERGHSVTLMDVNAEALEYARARHELGSVAFLQGNLEHASLLDQHFDLVFATEVLEHVRRPSRFLERLTQVVRPGGHLVITTPNANYRFSKLPSFGTAPQKIIDEAPDASQDGDAHRYLYSDAELGALVRGVGLRIVSSGSLVPFWLAGHAKTRYVHRLLYRIRRRIVRSAVGPTLDTRAASEFDAALWLLAQRPSAVAESPV